MSKQTAVGSNPDSAVLPVRYPVSHLAEVAKIAKKEDRTKGAVIRQALAEFLERKKR